MPGPRQPVDVLKAKGRKHLSQAEESTRRRGEIDAPPPEEVRPPQWLGKKFHKEFNALAELLIPLRLYSDLDADVLAQYLVTRERWERADKQASAAIRKKDEKLAKEWTNIQSSYFRQCRQCAEVMGLSVSARCKLVIPQGDESDEDDMSRFINLRLVGKEA